MKFLRLLVAFVALGTGACGSGQMDAAPASNAAAAPAAPVSSAALVVVPTAEIGAGGKAQPLPGDRTLICGDDARDCVCMEPAACESDGSCPGLQPTLAALREALVRKGDGAVNCEHAELGRCGGYSYLDFNGDQRHEVRWFDATGKQTGMREWTDYTAWCDGRARARFVGSVPRCAAPARSELLCGDAARNTVNPLDDLRNRFRARPSTAQPAK